MKNMKNKLIITESQYKRLINEQEDDYTDQLLSLINTNNETNLEMVKEIVPGQGIDLVQFLSNNIEDIEPPYFIKLLGLGVDSDGDISRVLNKIFPDFYIKYDDSYIKLYNKFNEKIYEEEGDNEWAKWIYDNNGNLIYVYDSYGFWRKLEYDTKHNLIYDVNSNGWWWKREYDINSNCIYRENSNGGWEKYEYDSKGTIMYYENSDGRIMNNRFKSI